MQGVIKKVTNLLRIYTYAYLHRFGFAHTSKYTYIGGGHVVVDKIPEAVSNGILSADTVKEAFRRIFRVYIYI